MHPYIFFLLLTSLSLLPHSTPLPLHHPPLFTTSNSHVSPHQSPQPIKFFEVTHPIPHPPTTPCTHLILSHDFSYTYGRSPVLASYTPPSHYHTTDFSTIILEWSATCQGRQFDRIFGVWLDGVELLRSCTAEPTRGGIFWKVQKDITRYHSLLTSSKNVNQTLAVYLGNLVDKTYTGVYHVNVTIYYYPRDNSVKFHNSGKISRKNNDINYHQVNSRQNLQDGKTKLFGDWADLILPISRNLPLNDGLWFEIENSTDFQTKEVVVPQNVYRAVLEVYVSYHENDEFWYSNLPNDYLVANNLTGQPGNGPFREVLVSLDGDLIGAIWPFTVIYTGGVDPLLWRPISAIGSYDLPSYDIEVTPFLGKLLDGKLHKFGFSVTNALNVWYVDANLHLWVDKNVATTKGELLMQSYEPLKSSSRSDFKGLNGKFFIGASRSMVSSGWVESSYGNITTTSIQRFAFENFMVLGNDGNLQIVNQTIDFNTSVSTKVMSSSAFNVMESRKRFPLLLCTDEVRLGNNSYTYQSNVTLGFNEDKTLASESKICSISLRNHQKGEGDMLVKNNLVVSGLGSTHQVYEYDESCSGFCYFRNISSYNYTILYDKVRGKCKSDSQYGVAGLRTHGIRLLQE